MAADAVAPMARTHRAMVLAELQAAYPGGRSSEQIAEAMGISVYSVRSRVSELIAAGHVEETAQRTRNEAGRTVAIWRARA
jgi:predicted ArsR family transcriptional regulator